MGVLLAILLAQSPVPDIDGPILSNPATMSQLAFFEFAPASGAGMGTACACAAVTGAKGEAMTFTRSSSATCTKTAAGGLSTTDIADGDLVTCATNQPRVEYDNGVLGLLVESARTNLCLRSQELDNAAWADVGTPAVTANAGTAPDGTATMESLADDAAGAEEGRSQAVTVTAAAAYTLTCYAKAGTATAVTLVNDTTTCACSNLSATTATRCECADASASGASSTQQVLVGAAAADTGSVLVWGCQLEAGTYVTSYVPTTSAAVTRSAESASFAVSFANAPLSMAATVSFAGTRSSYVSAISLYTSSSSYVLVGQNGAGLAGVESYAGTGASSVVASALATGDRVYGFVTAASTIGGLTGGKNGSNAISGNSPASATHTTLNVGNWAGAASLPLNGLVSRICLDPVASRCR